MTFLLKFLQAGKDNAINVAGIEEALSLITQADTALEQPTLFFEPKQTHCALHRGLPYEAVAEELDSQWEWPTDDSLKVHPRLKAKYQT